MRGWIGRALFGAPDVVASLDADRGSIFLVVENVGSRAALDVSVTLEPEWTVVASDADPDARNPFAILGVLPPGRALRTVIAPLNRYDGPATFVSTVTFGDDRGHRSRREATQTPESYGLLRDGDVLGEPRGEHRYG